MSFRRFTALALRVCLALPALAGLPLGAAADFPPITDAERAITSVKGEPNAPVVVIFKKGEFLMMGYGSNTGYQASTLRVQVRKKILTEEGKSNGEIVIGHSDSYRLQNFKGRTVLPDGQVVPIAADAKFVRKTSRSQRTFATAVAFPSVQVGAILDYQYDLRFDSIFLLEPWYFSEEVPVLSSEIVFKLPIDVRAQAWSRSTGQSRIQMSEAEASSQGYSAKAWAENLPSVPDDPYGPPFEDLAAQALLLPSVIHNGYIHEPLMENWPATCKLLGDTYDEIRRRDGGVAKRAKEIAGTGTPRQQAEALYRFVRDKIENGPYIGVIAGADSSLAKILSEGRANRAERALLLQSMLKTVKVDSRLVWAGDRNRGAIDPQLASPTWFDTVLVVVELDGERIFLDPGDRTLAFGKLQPGYEGTPALIHDKKKPEQIVLSQTPFDQNLWRAEIELALDEQGRLAGTGQLLLTGQSAWDRTGWKPSEAETLKAWEEWLAGRFDDFRISDVKAVESVDERKVTVTWSLAQREEEVLGDEVTVSPSAPLGPRAQPFVQPVSARRSGVMFDYANREEVQLRLRWPEGWKVEGLPRPANVTSEAGALVLEADLKEGERTLVYTRRFDLTRRELNTAAEYEAVRFLFGEVEKRDAQPVFLVRK